MRKSARLALLLGASLALPISVPADDGAAATAPITALERAALSPSREMLELGKSVAERACADCHGLDGLSLEPGQPHLAGQRAVYLRRVMQSYQSRERRSDVMNHASGFLSEDALLAVSAYYASLTPSPAAPLAEADMQDPAADVFAGVRDATKKCIRCHGEDGNSSASGMPNLTAQHPDYFVASMKAYAAKERDHRLMTRLASGMDEKALADMAVFYAVQKPLRTETTGDGDAQAGAALAEPCASCHGDDGNASGNDMPTLAGQDARYFIKAMDAYKDGSRQHEKMFEAVGELGEADVANLAAFYASQEPVRRNVRIPLTTAEWIGRCERCHGIDGNSTDPRFPMLAGQDEMYLRSALEAYAGKTRRGFCPSCGARRMADSAALLVDEVLPHQPMRQWVLSVPFPLRFLFAAQPAVMGKVLGIVYRAIATHLRRKAGYTKATAQTGAVTLIQRFGGAVNLNIHFHMLFLDGVYIRDSGESDMRFGWVKAPTSDELTQLTHTIAQRVARCLERQGLLVRDAENGYLTAGAADEENENAMNHLLGSSITYRIAIGPQQGHPVGISRCHALCIPA